MTGQIPEKDPGRIMTVPFFCFFFDIVDVWILGQRQNVRIFNCSIAANRTADPVAESQNFNRKSQSCASNSVTLTIDDNL